MSTTTRRQFLRRVGTTLGSAAALSAFPPSIRKAMAIAADRRSGTIEDVDHIVLLMMENRSFDHYFGSMNGVRGFADRFPIPLADAPGRQNKTVWYQRDDHAAATAPSLLAPQRLDTALDFSLLRSISTPHLYPDAQEAWDHGRMGHWPQFKTAASMVYFTEADLPYQFALANAFTLCDASHCSMTGGTNPNRCFFFTGTNHGRDAAAPGVFNGPAVNNAYSELHKGPLPSGYTWTSYAERLEDAGVSWQIYQNQEVDFYALNPLLGFRNFREANAASMPTVAATRTARQQALYEKGIRTRDLDLLRADVIAGRLPKVSWICPTASGSEHPTTSTPAQGAAYVAHVLDALTADPAVWSRTALIVSFDENDGLFDHAPPPAPPSYLHWDADPAKAQLAGASTVDARDEYLGDEDGGVNSVDAYRHRPWGLGPRVPMYVISPWSKGGWVNSQVFDQTSTIRFIETRFGVKEPNISAWRRAVTGDLTSCFDFATPNDADLVRALPDTARRDAASRTLRKAVRPAAPALPTLPAQASGTRPSRPLPYELQAACEIVRPKDGAPLVQLHFDNSGSAGAVFHVYDRLNLDRIPNRYTVEPGKQLSGAWSVGAGGEYDLWLLGPNGFHRHFTGAVGDGAEPEVTLDYDKSGVALRVVLRNDGPQPCRFILTTSAYGDVAPTSRSIGAGKSSTVSLPLASSQGWYDYSVGVESLPAFSRRFAGRLETGAPSTSDPAMHGGALGDQYRRG